MDVANAFSLLTQILSIAVICLWLLVAIRTVIDSISGKMFYAPCVAEYEKERTRKELEAAGAKAKGKRLNAPVA